MIISNHSILIIFWFAFVNCLLAASVEMYMFQVIDQKIESTKSSIYGLETPNGFISIYNANGAKSSIAVDSKNNIEVTLTPNASILLVTHNGVKHLNVYRTPQKYDIFVTPDVDAKILLYVDDHEQPDLREALKSQITAHELCKRFSFDYIEVLIRCAPTKSPRSLVRKPITPGGGSRGGSRTGSPRNLQGYYQSCESELKSSSKTSTPHRSLSGNDVMPAKTEDDSDSAARISHSDDGSSSATQHKKGQYLKDGEKPKD